MRPGNPVINVVTRSRVASTVQRDQSTSSHARPDGVDLDAATAAPLFETTARVEALSAATPSALARSVEADAGEQLLLLGEVQPENRIEGVEDPACLAAVLLAEAIGAGIVDEPTEQ